MKRAELERHAALLFGRDDHGKPKHGWQAWLASKLPGKSGGSISRETIRLWMRNDTVPVWAADMIRAMASIAPPPGSSSDENRDAACIEALEPELTRLRDLAVSVGWHPAEVAAAVLSLTLSEIRENAGDEAIAEILHGATSKTR
ncbi:hypothetical protein F8A10_07585 [Paracoccus kondratievae]|uniref:hypothetical protein n=1 Tax=Paracoccus kondratievae TaxID=135740 RepID=UPI00126681A0|nr:hypothetical protein [Paracoccus kondratievae]QFQ87296.1 hypothetical protein F8A10_07585 [Paracoccus kondratievae]